MSQESGQQQLLKFLELIRQTITPKIVQYTRCQRLLGISLATLLPTSDPTLVHHVPALVEVCVTMIQHSSIQSKKTRPRKYKKKKPHDKK